MQDNKTLSLKRITEWIERELLLWKCIQTIPPLISQAGRGLSVQGAWGASSLLAIIDLSPRMKCNYAIGTIGDKSVWLLRIRNLEKRGAMFYRWLGCWRGKFAAWICQADDLQLRPIPHVLGGRLQVERKKPTHQIRRCPGFFIQASHGIKGLYSPFSSKSFRLLASFPDSRFYSVSFLGIVSRCIQRLSNTLVKFRFIYFFKREIKSLLSYLL